MPEGQVHREATAPPRALKKLRCHVLKTRDRAQSRRFARKKVSERADILT
jgi:hypothetical protein